MPPDSDLRNIDARNVPPRPDAVLAAYGAQPEGRVVLLVDGYELLAPLDEWFRTALLPGLPPDAVVVLAGRLAPDPAWVADPAWRGLLTVLPLRNLAPAACREYLTASGADPASHERVIEATYGHPLALSLLADLVAGGGDSLWPSLGPDVVSTLLRRFLDVVPTPDQRRALAVCALARATDEPLLRSALGIEDAGELFEWLRGQSFIESGRHGLFPHDLARDVLDVDLRWRDHPAYDELFRRVGAHVVRRLRATPGQERVELLFDAKYLHRYQPISATWADWPSFGRYYPEPLHPGDADRVLTLVRS